MIQPTNSEQGSIPNFRDACMNKGALYKSGSNWSSEHVSAFHAHRFEDIPLERFFQEYLPGDDDQGMSQRI